MKFRSKPELVAGIREAHEEFLAVARSIPRSRYGEPGVWGDEWSVKDLFAHLTAWEQMLLGWHQQGLAGENPVLPAPGYKWNETPRLNRDIQQRYASVPWRRIRSDFNRSYQAVLAFVEGRSERELLEPGHFPWTRKLPLTSYVAPNTLMHYRTAKKILNRWKRTVEHGD